MEEKTAKESEAIISRVMLPPDANVAGNVFGGTILKMIDEIAGIVAIKHCRKNSVTANIEHIDFIYPVHIGDLLELRGRLNFVGKSSMEVGVEVFAENLETGDINFAGRATVTMVALDGNGKPIEVPKLKLVTEEDRQLYNAGLKRYNERVKRLKVTKRLRKKQA
ncbi:MAG: acyl-CoA thioesterase [Candidatus Thermoplasmatota archaeon]|jgi:acyl-CoA hydrolase|nr:acyl-CoA thioesterase [Candidatus Thermoplasmatota archaeon]MCL5930171.1 acyl-CoA thioesterase [Candidatus Thermoplasmatota archaeon]